ncbi:MAG: LL-diaminopimelate aminotransferase [Muribaculaceae bacterium]|nr:LL-diaminopimelate aminotransferase [Muribaculaceae bacterium]
MFKINDNFTKLPESYLFSEVARRINAFKDAHPEADIIRMGIGDVTKPLCPAAIESMHKAVDDESHAETFHGYGPEQGYAFLRDAISNYDYKARCIDIEPDEIFVSDGAKSDTGNIGDLLDADNVVALTDPVYPVYADTNVMAGRAGELVDGSWSRLVYLPVSASNNFEPQLPERHVDVIYLCYPNNPTGTALTRSQLQKWVDYARREGALIMFDSAYEAFIHTADVPHSIYELPGAKEVAIEFRSFSKTAGFTGVRCGYTVVPKALKAFDATGKHVSMNRLWNRRQCTKFNGASYISQRGASAIFTPEGRRQSTEAVEYYMENARMMREGLREAGFEVYGGVDAPYVWLRTPDNMTSWEFFDWLLTEANVAGTPGSGFGPAGEGYFRLTAFNTHENTRAAIARIAAARKK